MALMGRGGEFDLGRGPVRKRKARARSRAAMRGRFQVELLETRVLLFGDPFAGQIPVIAPGALAPPAVVSYAVPAVPNADLDATVFPTVKGQTSDFGPALVEPAPWRFWQRLTRLTGQSRLESAAPVALAGPKLLSAVAGESSYQVAGPAPFRAIERGDGLSQITDASGTDSVLGDNGSVTSSASSFQNGFGPAGLGIVVFSSLSSGEGTGGFAQAESYRETFDGTLDEAHPFSTVEFTINAPNESLAFALHSADAGGVMAAFGPMRLFNPDGSPLAEFDPELGPAGVPPQTFNLPMRDAPVGGRVFLQIVPSESSTVNAAGTTEVAAPAAADWSVPFVLNVQRRMTTHRLCRADCPPKERSPSALSRFRRAHRPGCPRAPTVRGPRPRRKSLTQLYPTRKRPRL